VLYRITFNKLSGLLVDFVDSSDGFLYLRMVGAEPTVNAIWATLSAKEGRGKKWTSPVQIPIPGRSYPERVAAQKSVTYRTLRSRLPSGMIDLALGHPVLTVAEDTKRGFFLLSYEPGMPAGFFKRLNASLSIPLKPNWASWLWDKGQQPLSRLTIQRQPVFEAGQRLEKVQVVETTDTPISRMQSLGQVACYSVHCDSGYKEAWLQLIRQQLDLAIRLQPIPHPSGGHSYRNGHWSVDQIVLPESRGWQLTCEGESLAQAPSLNHLLTEARESLGLHFIIEEDANGPFSS